MNYKEKFQHVKAIVFDVDGVFTDGSLILDNGGDLQRVMNTKDGFIIKYAKDQGLEIGIISGGKSNSVLRRFMDLGLEDVYLGIKGVFSQDFKINTDDCEGEGGVDEQSGSCKEANKMDTLRRFCEKKQGIEYTENVLFMGDDIPDLEILSQVYLSCCPADAVPEVKSVVDYVSPFSGGKGCVRDVVVQVLKAQNKWLNEIDLSVLQRK